MYTNIEMCNKLCPVSHFFHIFNNIKPHILLYEMITKQCNAIEVDVKSLEM